MTCCRKSMEARGPGAEWKEGWGCFGGDTRGDRLDGEAVSGTVRQSKGATDTISYFNITGPAML